LKGWLGRQGQGLRQFQVAPSAPVRQVAGVCNRYTLIDPASTFAEIARILGVRLDQPDWVKARYNLGLMQVAPTIVNRGSGTEAMPMRFGGGPQGASQVFGNARAETIFEKRTFKQQAPAHRCAIPTTGFIDWETDDQGQKWPHLFTLDHGRPFTMAAIWNAGDPTAAVPPHFYIVTTAPNELVARHHDRMPVILPPNRLARWLDPTSMAQPEFLDFAQSYPAGQMREREISDFANNVKHEGPECLEPAKPRPNQLGFGF
jgi:putative SOS response-associated peptidase YedK